jgi:hypothetical protein
VQQIDAVMPQVTLDDLPAGFYMITAVDEEGVTYRGKLMMVK